MKISICYEFVEGPWGGINQFLKSLKKEFINQGFFEEDFEKADILLFNGHPFGKQYFFDRILNLKQKFPDKIILYRIDGPISLYRDEDGEFDRCISMIASTFADGVIFQSNWCREQNKELFNVGSHYETVIYNAPDGTLFNQAGKKEVRGRNDSDKIKLIATSWSDNWNKGFEIYKYLDENLDFLRYEMTFVGNTPVEFKNIKHVNPVPSEELSGILREHNIYITASRNDPCSNSLIEALSCGLPSVALNDGGHPELIDSGGELFNGKEDVISKIEKVVNNYDYYKYKIPVFSIEKVAKYYYNFAYRIYKDVTNGKYKPKKLSILAKMNFYRMKFIVFKWNYKKMILSKLIVIKAKFKW